MVGSSSSSSRRAGLYYILSELLIFSIYHGFGLDTDVVVFNCGFINECKGVIYQVRDNLLGLESAVVDGRVK